MTHLLIIGSYTGLIIGLGVCAVGWWSASRHNGILEEEISFLNITLKECYDDCAHCHQKLADENTKNAALQTELGVAEKKLSDLEGQTPGRDKSGRFVKRDKVSLQKI